MLLLIDNYDSFSHTLARYFEEIGLTVTVVKHDDPRLDTLDQFNPDYLVFSPGPGSPAEAGKTLAIIENALGKLPILGICLGHQCLAAALGARVVAAPQVMHGKTSLIEHNNDLLFDHIPKKYRVTRYHSLIVEKATLPDCFETIAVAGDEIMAIKHKQHYAYGIQYHPEAHLTEYGHQLLNNFIEHAR